MNCYQLSWVISPKSVDESDMEIVISIVVIAVMVWLSVVALKWLFIGMKKALGFIGPYIAGAVPASLAYLVTHGLFGVGLAEASITSFLTAVIAGTVVGNM